MTKKYSRTDLMKLAIEEHLQCIEFPRVGTVISKDGILLSSGHRGEIKGVHAERVAIEKLNSKQLEGSTLFTTLEPCIILKESQIVESCSDLIINSGIVETVIGVLDPNGTIYSEGYRKLLENKINVSFFNRKLRQSKKKHSNMVNLINW